MSRAAYLSALELSQLRLDNEDHMMDTAVIYTRTDVLDALGQPIPTWTAGETIVCGFAFSPFKFRSRELNVYGAEETSEILVRARIPIAYINDITTKDRLYLTHLKGEELDTPDIYDVQGFLEIGPSAIVVNLKMVDL